MQTVWLAELLSELPEVEQIIREVDQVGVFERPPRLVFVSWF